MTAVAALAARPCNGVTVSVDDEDVFVVVGVVSTELKRLRLRFEFAVFRSWVPTPPAIIVDDLDENCCCCCDGCICGVIRRFGIVVVVVGFIAKPSLSSSSSASMARIDLRLVDNTPPLLVPLLMSAPRPNADT